MLDYRGLAALQAIIDYQSFDTAASRLHITQSAISQRLKALENYYGEALLIRHLPYKPSDLGERLLSHFQKVMLLEHDIAQELVDTSRQQTLRIAVNRDSLETWLPKVLNQQTQLENIHLQINADDQELTLDYLRKGRVHACLSTEKKPLPGCYAVFLGFMDYVLVCSPAFKQRYFKGRLTAKKLNDAPAVIFDSNDHLHDRFLAKYFPGIAQQANYHIVPSIAGFRQFALQGYAYALIPALDVQAQLKKQELVLVSKHRWQMPLYWHHWCLSSSNYQRFNQMLTTQAKKELRS